MFLTCFADMSVVSMQRRQQTFFHAFKKRDVAAAIEMNKLYQPKKEKQKKE
jgi:hypothetical protein